MITYVPSSSGGWRSLILPRSRARRQPSSGTSVVPELVRLRLLRMYDDKVLVVTIVHIGGRVYCSITGTVCLRSCKRMLNARWEPAQSYLPTSVLRK